ncbi:protein DBF4 homolog A [Acanthochromis polyacanthus]|uniref:protein DBF4 homolog A n=1 Tax=Acanthochromis polyacanthus TaxID=80966 RepID=UPI002234DA8D|nr:protein DBF4 homolog A [Acanthochromis polyacanthus]
MKENKMKPKRTQKPTAPKWEGKGGNTGDKTTLSHAKQTSLVSSAAKVRPFAGKVFYLDLPSNRIAERLEADIKDLGGTVEKFFSKEIRYLVSNKREARYVHCLTHDSPVPSPDSGQSSPHPPSNPQRPGSHGDGKSRSQGQTEAFVTSRGKSLVERVVKGQERVQMNKMLSNALDWGVKVLYINDVLTYVQKKKRIISRQIPAAAAVKRTAKAESASKRAFQKIKGGRICKPFIKVEDSSRHYRPIHLTMPNMPEFNLRTVAPCSPFCANEKDPPGNKRRGQRGVKASGSEEKAHGRKKNRDKKRGGYCECCMIKYDSLTMHLHSERHKAFSRSDKYSVVDRLISSLPCDFIHFQTKVKRPKCSVSSAIIIPGPCGRPDFRQEGDVETVDGDEGSYSEHNLKVRSTADSSALIHGDGIRRKCSTYSNRSKHKSLARKRPCRQNSLTSYTEKAELTQISEVQSETSHYFPSRVPQTEQVNHISHRNTSSSTSPLHNMDIHSERNLSGKRNVPEDPDTNRDSLTLEAVQDRNAFQERVDEKNLPEKEEDESFPTQSFSPVRKIQRRVRVYKRKRRKLDANVEHENLRDVSDSLLNLWKLFQSSDDMDVEFHGFPD